MGTDCSLLLIWSPASFIHLRHSADPYDKQMGALKYVEELQKKKQSDVLRFLLRVRCWEVRQSPDIAWTGQGFCSTNCGTPSVLLYTRWTLLRVHQYSSGNWMSSIEHHAHRGQTRLVALDTRPSRAMSFIVCECVEEAGSGLYPREPLTVCQELSLQCVMADFYCVKASQRTRGSISSSINARSSPLLRNVLGVAVQT